jgi:hypothetical protein
LLKTKYEINLLKKYNLHLSSIDFILSNGKTNFRLTWEEEIKEVNVEMDAK